MSYTAIKWILIAALLLTAPAMLFLVQAVFFLPAIFYLAGTLVVIPKAFTAGHASESLSFLLFLGGHFAVYLGLYALVSTVVARLVCLLRPGRPRTAVVAVLVLALVSLAWLPIYGGGGHGPIRWSRLAPALAEIDRGYGAGTVAAVYGFTVVLVAGGIWLRRRRRSALAPGPDD